MGGLVSLELDVRDLDGHLDFTWRVRAGTLSRRVKEATHGVAAVCVLLLGFQVKLGLVRGKFLPAGLCAVEVSCVSASSLSAFRAAIVRSVWSSKMPLSNTPVVLNLLDGLVGVDPAFHIIWTRFRLMRRNLTHRPLKTARIIRMLDLVANGPPGHGPVHLLLMSAAELGLSGMESSKVGFVLLFRSSKLVLSWRTGRGFGERSFWISVDLSGKR